MLLQPTAFCPFSAPLYCCPCPCLSPHCMLCLKPVAFACFSFTASPSCLLPLAPVPSYAKMRQGGQEPPEVSALFPEAADQLVGAEGGGASGGALEGTTAAAAAAATVHSGTGLPLSPGLTNGAVAGAAVGAVAGAAVGVLAGAEPVAGVSVASTTTATAEAKAAASATVAPSVESRVVLEYDLTSLFTISAPGMAPSLSMPLAASFSPCCKTHLPGTSPTP